MQNRYNIEIINYIFQNIRKDFRSFNNIIIYFCDNFRQILSIIKGVKLKRIIIFILKISYL